MKCILLLVFLLYSFSACQSFGPTKNIKIEYLSLKKGEPSSIQRTIGQRDKDFSIGGFRSGNLLIVKIKASIDLLRDGSKPGLGGLGAELFFCSTPELVADLGLPQLYIKGRSLQAWGASSNAKELLSILELSSSVFEYELVLFERSNRAGELSDTMKKNQNQTHYLQHDLLHNTEDICLYLDGGRPGQLFSSNTISINAYDIVDVMR